MIPLQLQHRRLTAPFGDAMMIRLSAACVLIAVAAMPAAHAQVATAAPTYDAAEGKLTAAEVATVFAGRHQEYGVDAAGHAWTIDAGGTGGIAIRSGTWSDTGHMTIRGDQVCVSWKKAWAGAEKCFRYAHHGAQYASYGPDGALNSTLTVVR
jgi:hypothetical protein